MRTFTVHPVATIFTILALICLVALGSWQLQRRTWKIELIATINERLAQPPVSLEQALKMRTEEQGIRYLPVSVRGIYDHRRERHVFGTLGAIPGYFIFTPFILEGGVENISTIAVNRGFVPQAQKAMNMREEGQIDGVLTIVGLFRLAEEKPGFAKLLAPSPQADQNIWYSRDPSALWADEPGIQNWYLDSNGRENPAPSPAGGTTKITFSNRHLEYALTWYGLALTLVGVYLAYGFRRRRASV